MTPLLSVLFSFIGGLLVVIIGDLVSEEVRGQLDRIPMVLLKIAGRRLPRELREEIYEDEWLPELLYILRRAEARPVSRLLTGTRFSFGLLRSARRIARARAGASSIELKRLISATNAMQVVGNIAAVLGGYILICGSAMILGLVFSSILGLVGVIEKVGWVLGLTLTVVLGVLVGSLVGLFVSPSMRLALSRWVKPHKTLIVQGVEPRHGAAITALRALQTFITGPKGNEARGIGFMAFLTYSIGLALGIVFGVTLRRSALPFEIAGATLAFLAVLRVALVDVASMWFRHRQRRAIRRKS